MTTVQSDDCQNDSINSFAMSIESIRFPLDSSMRIIFTGYYNGFNVEVRSPEEMAMLHHMGCFGKGSLSRSKPRIFQHEGDPCLLRKRQFLKRTDWSKKFYQRSKPSDTDTFFKNIDALAAEIINESEKNKRKDVIDLVSSDSNHSEDLQSNEDQSPPIQLDMCDKQDLAVIVPNSDSDGDNYFEKFKPECCLNKVKVHEKLMLTLQEAFFLSYGLGCLQVMNADDKVLTTDQLWDLFIKTDKNFVIKYVAYHYFRSKGYIVKSGIKFGGSYLLYKDVPAITHADYIVVVKDEKEILDWISLLGHVRVGITTVKEIMIAEISKSNSDIPNTPENLSSYSVREIVLTRKNPFGINDDD